MMQISTDDLLEHVDSRYTLIVMVSKRARQLVDGSEPLIETDSKKPVTIAVEEIAAGEVIYERVEEELETEELEELKEA